MTQEINAPLLTETALPERSLRYLSSVVGKLPPMLTPPAAWFFSMDKEVLAGHEKYEIDYKAWRDSLTELLELSELDPATTSYVASVGHLVGLKPTLRLDGPPRWWRETKEGYLVPRKRTKAEKTSEVSQRFDKLHDIPRAVDYLKGMPSDLWTENAIYPVHVRKPGQAVLAFLGHDPDHANPPFIIGNQWSRLKLSMLYSLKEYQETWSPK